MVKQETKNKLYAITTTLDVSPILVSKIGNINTKQDVKNISQEIKDAIHKRNTNMKNANRKQVRKLTNRARQTNTEERARLIKEEQDLMAEQKKYMLIN